jgi:RNA polymerase sigma factor (sigma-70 family)
MPASHHDDQADLTALARSASTDALEHLARRHLDFVFGVARRATGGDYHLAEDVAQAVFIILSRRAGRIRAERLCSWLFTTTRNVAANAMKAAARRRYHERRAAERTAEGQMSNQAHDVEHLQIHLQAALSAQREKDRAIVLMRYVQEMEIAQISELLGLTEVATRKRLGRAIERLRRNLVSRGLTAGVLAIGAALTRIAEPAPPALASAISAGAGVSGASASFAAALARSAIFWNQLQTAAVIILSLALLAGFSATAWRMAFHPTATVALGIAPNATSPATAPAETVTYSGVVRGPDGRPVAGVRVRSQLLMANPARSVFSEAETITDASGKYSLPPVEALPTRRNVGLEWRQRTIYFDHPDYAIAYANARPESDASSWTYKDVYLEVAKEIAIKVTDSNGTPVPDAEVQLYLQHFGGDFLSGNPARAFGYTTLPDSHHPARTDTSGVARFTRVPATARAHVRVLREGFALYDTMDVVRSDAFPIRAGKGAFNIILQPGGQIRLHPPKAASGSRPPALSFAEFSPVPEVQNTARPARIRATAESDGAYLLRGLTDGVYDVYVSAELQSESDGVWAPIHKVQVTAGTTTDADLHWMAGQVLTGKIVDPSTRRGASGVAVTIIPQGGSATGVSVELTSGIDGSFVKRLEPGSYLVRAYGYKDGRLSPVERTVELTANAPADVGAFEISGAPTARGRLVGPDGKPVAGLILSGRYRSRSAPDGAFELPVSASGPDRERPLLYAFDSTQLLGAAAPANDFADPDLARPGATLPLLSLRATSKIVGIVVDPEGQPVQDPQIRLNFEVGDGGSYSTSPRWGGLSQEQNRFTFKSMPAGLGEFRVEIRSDDLSEYVQISDLLPGEVRDLGEIRLKRSAAAGAVRDFTGKVSGRVLDSSGKPMMGVQIQASPESRAIVTPIMDVTDQDGWFQVSGLPLGDDVRLFPTAPGYERSGEAAVFPVGTEDAELHMSFKAARLMGKPAPELQAAQWVSGDAARIADLKGKVVLLHLGASAQDYAIYNSQVMDAHRKYADRGLAVIVLIGHAPNDRNSTQVAIDSIKLQNLPFRVAIDGPGRISQEGFWIPGSTAVAYAIQSDGPAYILIDKTGIVRESANYANLNPLIEKLLAE